MDDASGLGVAGDGAGSDARRDPGGRGAAMLAWIATIALVGVVIWMQALGRNAPAPVVAAATPVEAPDPLVEMIGRYSVWGSRLVTDPKQREPLIESFESVATGPAGKFRAAIVGGELIDAAEGLRRLEAIDRPETADERAVEEEGAPDAPMGAPEAAAPEPDAAAGAGETNATTGAHGEQNADADADADGSGGAIPDELREDMATMRAIWRGEGSAPTAEALRALEDRHGWFGALGAAYGKDDTDPGRAAALAKASRTGLTLLFAAFGAGGVVIVGFGLGIVALALFSKGKIRAAYAPPARGGSVYLEAFAVFLAAFLVVAILSGLLYDTTGVDVEKIAVWALIVCPFWPLLRGARWAKHRYAIGLHAGAKKPGQPLVVRVAREMGAGLLGYVAGMPIFMLGILGTLALFVARELLLAGAEGGEPPSHPVVHEIGKGGVWGAVALLVLASVWAPLVEELMFRGCFYHHLRGRWRAVASGLIVALVFAAIHPPGVVAVPALMSLALVFSLIREWRGSIIGCMTAHAVHNGALLTTLLLAMG